LIAIKEENTDMFRLLKKIFKFLYIKKKYRKEVEIPFSANVARGAVFEGMNKLYPKCSFTGKLGFGSYIGPNSEIAGVIGRYTSIGPNVKVITGTHPLTYPFVTTSPAFFSLRKQNGSTFTKVQRFDEHLIFDKSNNYAVKIGNDCWVGERAMVVGGIQVGDGAVILAGAIVTKDVPAYAIVGGIPATVLRYRYRTDSIDFLLKFKWWGKELQWLQDNVELMNNMENLENEYAQRNY
jgi:acetyltransferase-like isoleucine patch superfamily enzyme